MSGVLAADGDGRDRLRISGEESAQSVAAVVLQML